MTPLRQRMSKDMQLLGLAPRTQGCYVARTVREMRLRLSEAFSMLCI